MKLITKLLLVAFLATSFMATAQDEAVEEEESGPQISISGSIDAYYRANLNASNEVLDTDADGELDYYAAPTSSFANLPGFSLGMANLIIGVEGEKAGFVADLVFGPRGTDAVFGSPMYSSTAQVINQMYAYWNVSDQLTLTLGNFNTFLGYEVISPSANFNYSTSYMFSYGPFSHTGLKLNYAVNDDLSLLASVMNPTDITEFNPTGDYVYGLQVGFKGIYLNGLFSEDYYQLDVTAGFDVTETVYLGVNATQAKDSFYGAALYLQNSFSDSFALGLRGEYFSQEDGWGALPGAATNVIDLTLSAQYVVGGLTFIPEVRIDLYDEDVIMPDLGEAPQSNIASFLLAAVYTF